MSWQNVRLCKIDPKGDVFSKPNMEEYRTQLDQVVKTSRTVSEYMRLIESAPPLQAKSLTMDYRLLSEHNGVVLAAHPSWFGAEFATWEWAYGHTALWQGHYTRDYESAKEDFAVRSGLIQAERQFTEEQLTELHRSAKEALNGDRSLTDRRRELLQEACWKIEASIPALEERALRADQQEKELELDFEQIM